MIGSNYFDKRRLGKNIATILIIVTIVTIYNLFQNEKYWNSLKYVDKVACNEIIDQIKHASSYEILFNNKGIIVSNKQAIDYLLGGILGFANDLAYDDKPNVDLDNASITCKVDRNITVLICSSTNRWNETIQLYKDGSLLKSYFMIYDKGGIKNHINEIYNQYMKQNEWEIE